MDAHAAATRGARHAGEALLAARPRPTKATGRMASAHPPESLLRRAACRRSASAEIGPCVCAVCALNVSSVLCVCV